MLRLRFDLEALARTRFATPYLLCELIGSVQSFQQPASPFGRRWRAAGARVPVQGRALFDLVPAHGGLPDFLAPEANGSLDELLDVVLSTPRARIRADLVQTHPAGAPSWVRELACGATGGSNGLSRAIRNWYHQVLSPVVESTQPAVGAELRRRSWQLATRGAAETLNTLDPRICWRDGVMEVESPVDEDVDLDGRGLWLVPSVTWTRPGVALHWEQPALTYPLDMTAHYPSAEVTSHPDNLGTLLGVTRSRILLRLTSTDETTSGLAASLGISPASASTHAAALRAVGLVATHREGRAVRHAATDLGFRLAGPATSVARSSPPKTSP